MMGGSVPNPQVISPVLAVLAETPDWLHVANNAHKTSESHCHLP